MARKIDPMLADILRKYECDPANDIWDCHGTWVAYHRTLEKIASKAGIVYGAPSVLVAERDAAAILVVGTLNDRSEWSIGEAVINQNYKVTGKQAAYPFAMAEKRAKDRVIIKLVGLHGVYSEEEADDFKQSQPAAPEVDDRVILETMIGVLRLAESADDLTLWASQQAAEIEALPPHQQAELRAAYKAHLKTLPKTQKEAA